MTDVRRERIPFVVVVVVVVVWNTVRKIALAKGFSSNIGDMKYPCD